MNCPHCGIPVWPATGVCHVCGTKATSPTPPPAVSGRASAGSVASGGTVAGIYAENFQMSPEAARELGKVLNQRPHEFTADPKLMDRFSGIDDKLAQLVGLLESQSRQHAPHAPPTHPGGPSPFQQNPFGSPPPGPFPSQIQFNPVGSWRMQSPMGLSHLVLYPNGALEESRQTMMGIGQSRGVWRYDPYHQVVLMQGIANGMMPIAGGFKVMAQQGNMYQVLGMSGQPWLLTRLA